MSLTNTKVLAAKPASRPYKITDEKGLYLFVTPKNAKYWRFKYRFDSKEHTLAFGVYPEVTLATAREKRDEARKLIVNNVDPGLIKKAKLAAKTESSNTFEVIAREWFLKFGSNLSPSYAEKIIRRFEMFIFPWLGNRSINEISAPELLAVLRRIEANGTIETAHRVRQHCSQVYRYAIATGRAERDPSRDLLGAIPAAKVRHYASMVDPNAIGKLLLAIDGYSGIKQLSFCNFKFV